MRTFATFYVWLRIFIALFTGTLEAIAQDSRLAELTETQITAYNQAYQQNRLDETALSVYLASAIRESEYLVVSIGLLPISNLNGLAVRLEEFGFDDFNTKHQSRRTTTFAVSSDIFWEEVIDLLSNQADWLTDALEVAWITPTGSTPFEIRLIFQFPRQRVLELIGIDCLLSERAQRYLTVTATSDYPSRRKVLIIQEPHYELDRQFNLFKGLEEFFKDNPRLLLEQRMAFLAEGLKSGEVMSVAPLVQAEPKPTDDLIYDILGTFQIPGYVAYEWKHQKGIPIIGSEDIDLHRFSAKVWTEMQGAHDEKRIRLWPTTVAARNPQITATFVETLKKHDNAILFVGGKHLFSLTEEETLRPSEWNELLPLISSTDIKNVRASDAIGIADILRSQGIGFWFISGRGSPFPNQLDSQSSIQQYISLFHRQLSVDSFPTTQAFGSQTQSVTVSPSTAEAAKSINPNGKINHKNNNLSDVFRNLLSILKNSIGNASKDAKEALYSFMRQNAPVHPDYTPPKKWNGIKVKSPNGKSGWPHKNGDIWIPSYNKGSHSPHWDVTDPKTGKTYRNVYP